MVDYPDPVKALIAQLKRLPGIGPKSAERIAIWLIQRGEEVTDPFADALSSAGQEVGECGVCGFFSTAEAGCVICTSLGRDPGLLCVIEQPTDILPLERSGAFRGHYHSLRGKISPLENIGPDDLRIADLIERIRTGHFAEVILALSADVEGEATAHYLVEILTEFEGLKVTRLAHGIPVGGGLENADELTLFRALEDGWDWGEGVMAQAHYTETGGLRFGSSYWMASNYTWPFANLSATPEAITLRTSVRCFMKRTFVIERPQIRQIRKRRGLWSVGIEIVHSVTEYPKFLLFWTFQYRVLKQQLEAIGYEIAEADQASSVRADPNCRD